MRKMNKAMTINNFITKKNKSTINYKKIYKICALIFKRKMKSQIRIIKKNKN